MDNSITEQDVKNYTNQITTELTGSTSSAPNSFSNQSYMVNSQIGIGSLVGNSQSDSDIILGNSTNIASGWSPDIYTSINRDFTPYSRGTPMTIELKLVDGRRVVETFSFNEIKEISECNDGKKRHTHVVFKRYYNDDMVEYDIDCNLSAFMRIVNKKYVPWSKTMMDFSVKEGEDIN